MATVGEPEPRRADRRRREGVRPLLLVGAGRDQPDRGRRRGGRHFWDYDGKRYLDFASQLVNVNIGHQHPKVVAAIKEQADKLCTIGPPMASESRSQLGLLAEVTRATLTLFFTNGGAEGERERDQARAAVHRAAQDRRPLPLLPRGDARGDHAHGRPAPLAGGAGHGRRRAHARPVHVPLPGRPPDPCPVCTGAPHLEEILEYEGPHTVAAVILETVTGTNGVIPPPDGYLQSIREACDRHGILLILDEVMAVLGAPGAGSPATTGTSSRTSSPSRRGSTPATSRSGR